MCFIYLPPSFHKSFISPLLTLDEGNSHPIGIRILKQKLWMPQGSSEPKEQNKNCFISLVHLVKWPWIGGVVHVSKKTGTERINDYSQTREAENVKALLKGAHVSEWTNKTPPRCSKPPQKLSFWSALFLVRTLIALILKQPSDGDRTAQKVSLCW